MTSDRRNAADYSFLSGNTAFSKRVNRFQNIDVIPLSSAFIASTSCFPLILRFSLLGGDMTFILLKMIARFSIMWSYSDSHESQDSKIHRLLTRRISFKIHIELGLFNTSSTLSLNLFHCTHLPVK